MREPSNLPVQSRLVMVIDDDDAVRHSLKFSLELEGFPVRVYSDAREFFNGTDPSEAACLVIDYNLPEMNGLKVLQELRRRHINVPAVMIASHPTRAVQAEAAAMGARIIEKPLLDDALLEGIRSILA